MTPQLLHCPHCKERRDNEALGSITSEGYFIAKRKYGRATMVMAESYSVICDCGFYFKVECGKIEMSLQINPND